MKAMKLYIKTTKNMKKYTTDQKVIIDYFDKLVDKHIELQQKFLSDSRFSKFPNSFDDCESKHWELLKEFMNENPI